MTASCAAPAPELSRCCAVPGRFPRRVAQDQALLCGIGYVTEKLIAHKSSVEQIREFLDVDSLEYLDLAALLRAAGGNPDHFCTACFTGNYPTPLPVDYATKKENQRHVDHSTAQYER